MNCAEGSDLEEGEILEYDSMSSGYSRGDLGIRNWSLESSSKENKDGGFDLKENKGLFLNEQGKDGYINKRLREKLNLNDKQGENKSSIINVADLESISSEGEYKSDEDGKYSADESEHNTCSNGEMKRRKKHSANFYGTVEVIMSEIGETICRKTRCNYKKRKSKELKQSLHKCWNNTYDLMRREIFSSHLKSKKRKRKGSFGDSESDLEKYRTDKKNKRRKRDVHQAAEEEEEEEEGTTAKKLKLRDFDEMRRSLLEKLKKQKAEEETKESTSETPLELENSEIQEIDMLIDCTNYVDNPSNSLPNAAGEGRALEEKEGEDELDLIKLRLIALASNRKRKAEEATAKAEDPEDLVLGKRSTCSTEEMDLDRNELLLRAEALKTALLKKHQRRLNRLKVGKPTETRSSSIYDVENSLSSPAEDAAKCTGLETEIGKFEIGCKENVERDTESGAADCSNIHVDPHSHPKMEKNKGSNTALLSNGNPKKTPLRGKSKRKKRKSVCFANNLKENNEKSEALEEDDSTLRTQLLSDLMKKKSLKDLEKKSVLLDSVQTAANKASPRVMSTEPPKEAAKPLPGAKKALLKKINAPKATKPLAVPKFPKPEIQRIIVHLGSEDSSDEDCALPQPPPNHPSPPSAEDIESKGSGVTESPTASKPPGELTRAKYERSVELLLSQARKKIEGIEGEKRVAATTLSTPEAVYKHLPPSQRLEYMRLKQKIAEREKLRNQKKESPDNPSHVLSGLQPVQSPAGNEEDSLRRVSDKLGIVAKTGSKGPSSSPDNSSSRRNMSDAPKAEAVSQKVRLASSGSKTVGGFSSPNGAKTKVSRRVVVNKMKNHLTELGGKSVTLPGNNGPKTAASIQRNLLLLPSSQALISKLKLLLKKIKIEKTIEENYETEISKLKNQLSLFEKKKNEQKFKIKKLWEESMKTYKAVQGITAKTKDKAVPKESEGVEKTKREAQGAGATKGAEIPEKTPEGEAKEEADAEEGKKVSDEPETKITQSKSDKELKDDDKMSEPVTDCASSGPFPIQYDSPLQAFTKVSDGLTRVDPNVTVCQFDLMGVCKDEECTFQHLRISAK